MAEPLRICPGFEGSASDGINDGIGEWERLTTCERASVELAADGLSNAGIARVRGVALSTLTKQLTSAYKKLGVRSRRELRATWSGRAARPLQRRLEVPLLSARERQVWSLALGGHANKVIAISVGVRLSTVSTLLTRARRKLESEARGDVVRRRRTR